MNNIEQVAKDILNNSYLSNKTASDSGIIVYGSQKKLVLSLNKIFDDNLYYSRDHINNFLNSDLVKNSNLTKTHKGKPIQAFIATDEWLTIMKQQNKNGELFSIIKKGAFVKLKATFNFGLFINGFELITKTDNMDKLSIERHEMLIMLNERLKTGKKAMKERNLQKRKILYNKVDELYSKEARLLELYYIKVKNVVNDELLNSLKYY